MPYLNNHSKETIFGSNKIKEQHETKKLKNEEVFLSSETFKTIINQLNRTGNASMRNFSEKSYLHYSILTLTK